MKRKRNVNKPLNLISESSFKSIISEETEGKLYIKGIFIQAETINNNKRIYPLPIVEREVSLFNEQFVTTSRAIGELNHPTETYINPERASHLITELKQDGRNFIGKARILDTPQGLIVKGLLQGGVQLGVSTRGVGSVKSGTGKHSDVSIVQDDFQLITIDIVSNPSAPEAFVEGIYESMQYMIKEGRISPYIPNSGGIKVRTFADRILKERTVSPYVAVKKLCKLIKTL